MDLYYDPVVNEHVGNGPMGLMAPAWYFAPQKREVARAGWQTAAQATGLAGDGPITSLNSPAAATMLLQIAGEFADPETKARLWAAAAEHIEPTWNHDTGEFTLGFGLNEAHPRGQWNARSMAGWVCREGDWARIFNQPNLAKFDEPTVIDVDFPRIALSEARWDGNALHLAAQPQNASVHGTGTRMRIINVAATGNWTMTRPDGVNVELAVEDGTLTVDLNVDNQVNVLRPG